MYFYCKISSIVADLNLGLQNGQQSQQQLQQQSQESNFVNRHNYPVPVSQQQQMTNVPTTVTTVYQSQNSPQSPVFPGYVYNQQTVEERLNVPERIAGNFHIHHQVFQTIGIEKI